MANRTRPIRLEFYVDEREHQSIRQKMQQIGTHNLSAYLRKMAIDGYIIKLDYTEQKKLAAAVSNVASNVNHLCKRINQTGHFYDDDIADMKARQEEIWKLLKDYMKKQT
ncbi:MAG: plasmid mobilization relaxosome protein MobC [Oscillospiraceae bacterium]|nr:plasmid mobilization relaxosome protein MobC [Oscillospiraceae bacterium]